MEAMTYGVRVLSDAGPGDVAGALRRLEAALPEAEIDASAEYGDIIVWLRAPSAEEARARVDDVLVAGGGDDPLRVNGEHRAPTRPQYP
jgi:hypothetical protein